MHKQLVSFLLIAAVACSRGNSTSSAGDSARSAAGDIAATGDPPSRAARLSSLDGDVSLQAPGSDSWSQAAQNYTVTTGDRLYTGPKARAEVDLGNAAMRLDHGSDLTVTNLGDHFTQLGLDQGAVDASLYHYDPADSVELDTPNGALVPTGAGTYLISVDPNDDATIVNVESGGLLLTGPGVNQTLNSGQIVRLVGTNPIQIVALTPNEQAATDFADLDRWHTQRDRIWLSSGSAATYVAPNIPGWEDLDANGVWTADDANTQVWCPTHVSRTWVPYRDGHWSWVEPWGWTWVDNANWGYAPFHYGRWETVTSSSCGASNWAWVPGPVVSNPVYAPALVSFVDAAALSLAEAPTAQGWFPLGPREAFFPWYHSSDRYLHDINVTNLREVTNIDPIIHVRNVDNVRWANRDRALTVVPGEVFRGGDPVDRAAIRVNPERIAAARVIAHPVVNPDPVLFAGGRPVRQPPIAARPQMVVTRAQPRGPVQRGAQARVAQPQPALPPQEIAHDRERGAARVSGGEVVAPTAVAPPGRAIVAPRREPSAAPLRNAPVAVPPNIPRGNPRTIITRNAPPVARPNVDARQSAMQAHPGRPLEPQQIQNMRAGHPAGPPRDVEVPPHPAAQPQPRPQPAQPAQPNKPPGHDKHGRGG